VIEPTTSEPTLLLIDLQRDYFPGGRHPLVDPDAAAGAAASVLAAHRQRGGAVVHVRHESERGFLEAGTPGAEIDARVAPSEGEAVVVKRAPNAFVDTALDELLRSVGGTRLVVAGMMTSMCVDATVRAAADLGYDVTVVADACAAPDLEFGGVRVPGASVHAAFLAALGSAYARVVPSSELLA
jgi:nicotinamidase-related amidase